MPAKYGATTDVRLRMFHLTNVAEGTVVPREVVHGMALAEDEVAVSASSIIGFDQLIHPKHEYPVEVGDLLPG